jgi:hypothetical protein
VATVETAEGSDLWTAVVWLRSDPAVVVRHPRGIEKLLSAKIKADHLARTQFNHLCTVDTCGEWTFVP